MCSLPNPLSFPHNPINLDSFPSLRSRQGFGSLSDVNHLNRPQCSPFTSLGVGSSNCGGNWYRVELRVEEGELRRSQKTRDVRWGGVDGKEEYRNTGFLARHDRYLSNALDVGKGVVSRYVRLRKTGERSESVFSLWVWEKTEERTRKQVEHAERGCQSRSNRLRKEKRRIRTFC